MTLKAGATSRNLIEVLRKAMVLTYNIPADNPGRSRRPEMPKSMTDAGSLKVLVCDAAAGPTESLRRVLAENDGVGAAKRCDNLEEARSEILAGDFNAVFIDPLSFKLEEASSFIFEARKAFPGIIFVLYLDISQAERTRVSFFEGERRRFSEYYQLDKRTPVAAFPEEVAAIVNLCRAELSRKGSSAKPEDRWNDAGRSAGIEGKVIRPAVPEPGEAAARTTDSPASTPRQSGSRIVFLSHRFAPEEYVRGLTRMLEEKGFEVATAGTSNTYLSLWVIDRIQRAGFFLSIMIRADAKTDGTFTASPWLLEEKGAALALGKPLLLLVEEGVSDFGGLQGEWQRINFGPKGFPNAAREAVSRLAAYAGFGRESAPSGESAAAAARRVRVPDIGPKRINDR